MIVYMRTTMALIFAIAMAGNSVHAERLAGGLEFHAPNGWTVKANDEAAVLLPPDMVMESDGKEPSELYLVARLPGIQDLQDPQLVSTLQGKYFPAGANVRASGPPQPFQAAAGPGYLYRYDAVSQGVALRLRIYAVALPGGGVAGLVAVARPLLLMLRETALTAVAASLSRQAGTAPPPTATTAAGAPNGAVATQWEQRLRGRKLYQFSGYSSTYGSGGMNSQKTLQLGVNGMYEFHRASSVSIDVSGASAGSASRNGAQGHWRIYERDGKVLLELLPSNGTPETIVLSADGTKTMLNGQRWLVGN
jgi:hypothetical protein